MNVKTKKMILTLVLVASIITIIGTVSFAYFTATGASSNQTATISTAKVSAVFSDADTGANATLNFGESFTKRFTIENDGDVTAYVKMYWYNLVNTYTEESLSYTLAKSTSGNDDSYEVFLGGDGSKKYVPLAETESMEVLADSIEVPVGTTYYELKVTLNYLEDVNQDSDLAAKFYSWFRLEDINYTVDTGAIDKIIASSKGTITNFDTPASTAESAGVYELADEGNTTSYYFRGPVENNYVRFGKWRADEPDVYVGHGSSGTTAVDFASLSACQVDSYKYNCTLLDRAGKDMYWRIIRVNGDGSLRMIYAGTEAYANGSQGDDTFIKRGQRFNALYDDAKYVGYMYSPVNVTTGTTTPSTESTLANPNEASSDIKVALEEWYANNLEANYGQYISKDATFCYDRSINPAETNNKGYGTNLTYYAARSRFISSAPGYVGVKPTFVCTQNNDKFTIEGSTIGNKALSKPVGLINADEVLAAGSGEYGTESDYYLKRNLYYWSGSPCYYGGGAAVVLAVDTSGSLKNHTVHGQGGAAAPVINLTAEYARTLVGDGTASSPYHLSTQYRQIPVLLGLYFAKMVDNTYKFNNWFRSDSSSVQSGTLDFGNNSLAFFMASFLNLLFIFRYSSVV